MVLEASSSRSRWVSGKNSLPGLRMATVSMCSHLAEREGTANCPYQDTHWITAPPLWLWVHECTLSVRLFATPWLLRPWDSPGKNTGVGYHFLLQGIFQTQGLNPCLLCLLHRRVDSSSPCHLGSSLWLYLSLIISTRALS